MINFTFLIKTFLLIDISFIEYNNMNNFEIIKFQKSE